MNLIFTCGGTAGHINPAIAIANMMKERYPDAKILFIGATGHMEEKLVPQAGFEVKCLPGSGLSRKLNPAGIKKNIHAVKCVLDAVKECKRTFREFKPYLDQCRFIGCAHVKEKGCAVLAALKAGDIQPSRHRSYVRLYELAKENKPWENPKG